MLNIPLTEILARMLIVEIAQALEADSVRSHSRHSGTGDACDGSHGESAPRQESSCYAAAKRLYRFVWNQRFNHHHRTVAQANPAYLVAVSDPVHFEKAYTEKSEGVSTVYKSTPPDLNGNARLSRRYPTLTATVVNMPIPVISYASWFSCKTADFVSENREVERAIPTTQVAFQHAGETRLTNFLAGHPALSPPSLRRYLRCGNHQNAGA